MIYIGNIEILTAKSAIYLGNVGTVLILVPPDASASVRSDWAWRRRAMAHLERESWAFDAAAPSQRAEGRALGMTARETEAGLLHLTRQVEQKPV